MNRRRDVVRELKRFPSAGTPFEDYISELFEDLNWTVYRTPPTADNGIDVIIISPLKKSYLIEAKNYQPISNKIDSKIIRSVYGGAEIYKKDSRLLGSDFQFAIVIASGLGESSIIDDIFTPAAKQTASTLGIKLWTFEQLQILADAATTNNHSILQKIGLETALPVVKNLKRKTWNLFDYGVLLFLAFLVIIFINVWFSKNINLPQIYTIETLNLTSNEDIERKRITDFILFWNKTYQNALISNNLESILPYMLGLQREGIIKKFMDRTQKGCVLSIQERAPFVMLSIEFDSAEFAKTAITRNASYIENCVNAESRIVRDGTEVKVTYDLQKINGNWRIYNSITSGGEIKK